MDSGSEWQFGELSSSSSEIPYIHKCPWEKYEFSSSLFQLWIKYYNRLGSSALVGNQSKITTTLNSKMEIAAPSCKNIHAAKTQQ